MRIGCIGSDDDGSGGGGSNTGDAVDTGGVIGVVGVLGRTPRTAHAKFQFKWSHSSKDLKFGRHRAQIRSVVICGQLLIVLFVCILERLQFIDLSCFVFMFVFCVCACVFVFTHSKRARFVL